MTAAKKRSAAASPPKQAELSSLPTTSSWDDANLKRWATLAAFSLPPFSRELKVLTSRVSPSDRQPSAAVLDLLTTAAFDVQALTTLGRVDERLIAPRSDGDDERFVVQHWNDLLRLENLETLELLGPQSAVPLATVLDAHPSLKVVRVPRSDSRGKSRTVELLAIGKQSGFGPTSLDGELVTLTRGAGTEIAALLLELPFLLPANVFRNGKGGFQLHLLRARFDQGALLATVRVQLTSPEGQRPPAIEQELEILARVDTDSRDALKRLKEAAKIVHTHLSLHQRLPATGSPAAAPPTEAPSPAVSP